MLTQANFEQIDTYFRGSRHEYDHANYWSHIEDFIKKPFISGDIDPGAAYAQATARNQLACNQNWTAAGTSMTTALVTGAVGGGITMTTAGANNDQAILQPFTQTSVAGTLFGASGASGSILNTSNQPRIQALISLSSVASVRFSVGLKLTNAVDFATDNDAAQLAFDTGSSVSSTKFITNSSIGGTDVTSVAAASNGAIDVTAAAATNFWVAIAVAADRTAAFYLNGVLVGKTTPLTASTGLWPVIGLQALTGAQKAMTIRQLIVAAKY